MSSIVQVNDVRMRVVTSGLDDRQRGEPVVVFESGGGTPLSTWDPVLPAVTRLAPVVTYDRSGTGESPWDSLPPTPAHATASLQALLTKLGVAPPYILVGHSWGGALVRFFAGRYPDQVAGLLYIDPTDITQTPADELEVFTSIGADAAARDAFYKMMEQALTNAPASIRAEAAVISELMRRELDQRGLGVAPPVPTSVIVAGRLPRFPRGSLPFDTEAYARLTNEGRLERLRTWVARGGQFVVAENAGHFVHADEPELVVDAIRHLIGRTR